MNRTLVSALVKQYLAERFGVVFNPYANYSRVITAPQRSAGSVALMGSLAAAGMDTRKLMGEPHG